jgi:Ni/Fe-hydrogenase subunit HybB-like protein
MVSPGFILLVLIAVVGLSACVYRFLFGLSSVTNLSAGYPWGIWKAVSVAAGVALATGGFTTAALVHIFHREKFEAILRPALLTALLGYTFGVISLVVDLGRYYNIWHPIMPWMWQGDSALFEVAMCIMIYVMIVYVEFVPILCERFIGRVNLPGGLSALNGLVDGLLRFAQSILNRALSLFILAGVVISCLHHSSLGLLMLIAPHKMNPLWYTPLLPLLFLLSVLAGGFAVVTLVSILTSWTLKQKPRLDVLSPLSLYIVFLQGVYLIAKISDLIVRGVQDRVLAGDFDSTMWLLEVFVCGCFPMFLLTLQRVRRSAGGLAFASSLIVAGLVLNRVNVFLVAFQSDKVAQHYFPSIGEIVITAGLAATFILVYRIALSILPVIPDNPTQSRLGASRRNVKG